MLALLKWFDNGVWVLLEENFVAMSEFSFASAGNRNLCKQQILYKDQVKERQIAPKSKNLEGRSRCAFLWQVKDNLIRAKRALWKTQILFYYE